MPDESKSLEKLMVTRIVQDRDLGLLNPSEIETEFHGELTVQGGNQSGGEREWS